MATTDEGIQLTIQVNGASYCRTYHKSDALNNVIVLGRLSSTAPDTRIPSWGSSDQQNEVGGLIVSPGRAAFVSPVMSRQHARLVFSGDNEASLSYPFFSCPSTANISSQPAFQVYISDPPNHSHHGTYLSRNGRTFRVELPQPLQTGDILTFGKTVHRGGQIYEPLSARVRILSMDATHQSFASYTGHGYSLPPNIDVDVDIEEDHEVYKDDEAEHPSTHKFYAVQEVQEDADERASVPSPIFPRGLDARQDLPPLMPGGFHGIPEASPFGFNLSSQSCLFEPPQVAGFLSSVLPNPPQDFNPFIPAPAPAPLPILGPILRGGPPPFPPVLPPLAQSRFRPHATIPVHAEVIDVDDQVDDREVIDVDAVGSPDSSVRETSPFDDDSRSSAEDSDFGLRTSSRAGSPATSAAASDISSEQNGLQEETGKIKDGKDLTTKLDKLLALQDQSKRLITANKAQLDTKIADHERELALLRSKVEAEHNGFTSELENRKKEIIEDLDSRKHSFMDDLNVYEDDVTYEVDRVMDSVEELNVKAGEGKAKVDEYVECAKRSASLAKARIDIEFVLAVRKLKEELEAVLRAQVDEIRAKVVGAVEEIDEVVAGVKRKREAMEEANEAQPRARSPSVAMSMSPEPEPEPETTDAEAPTEIGNTSALSDYPTPDLNAGVDTDSPAAEPPRKRQRLETKESQSPGAGRVLGALAATTVAVCWVLGKIGEMSTLGDV
ncbi:hypothetical protein FRC00_008244 [Tulasnella sp. 408]|nr:hypothetical protein FRC00_008244 [Tulasnella sp. 408]